MADIAKKLNNPVANLISVPFQNNFDFGGGPNNDGFQYKLNFQPVIPITFGINTESSYDWVGDQWTVSINAFTTQLIKVDKLPVSLQFGGRYYADKPAGGPDWGRRFTVTLVLPK
jgi:hypothetical protein